MPSIATSLASSLGQVFAVVIIGYACTATKAISQRQTQSLGMFIAIVTLSALFVKEIAELTVDSFQALIPVMLAKMIVFLLMGLSALMLKHETENFFLRWGIYGLSATQGHDLTIGLAIVNSVWPPDNGFNFVQAIYVYSTVQIIVFKTLSLFLIEYGNAISTGGDFRQSLRKVTIYLLKNPLVIAVFVGLIMNAACHGKLPTFLEELLGMISDAFTPGALFLLGVSSYGKLGNLHGKRLLNPGFFVCVKQIVLPVLIQVFSIAWELDRDSTNFNFLYGTMPIAATVPVLAAQYKAEPALMSSSSILSLVVGAPIMFVTCVLFSNPSEDTLSEAVLIIQQFANAISIIAGLLFIFGLLQLRKWRVYPFDLVTLLVLSQLTFTCTLMACQFTTNGDNVYIFLVSFFFRNACTYFSVIIGINLIVMSYYPNLQNPKMLSNGYIIIGFLFCLVNLMLNIFAHGDDSIMQLQNGAAPTCWFHHKKEAFIDMIFISFFVFVCVFTILILYITQRQMSNQRLLNGSESTFDDSLISDSQTTATQERRLTMSFHEPPHRPNAYDKESLRAFFNMDYVYRVKCLLLLQTIRLSLQLPLVVELMSGGSLSDTMAEVLFVSIIFVDAQCAHTAIAFCTSRDFRALRNKWFDSLVVTLTSLWRPGMVPAPHSYSTWNDISVPGPQDSEGQQ